MPDFTKQVHFHCMSVESCTIEVKGSTGKVYKVHRGRGRHVQWDWLCECKGFKFRGSCKHVEEAKTSENYCGWQEFVHGGEIVRDEENVPRCPECSNIAIAMEYAV